MAELADAADSKSADPYQVVGVRPPLPAPAISHNQKYLRAIGGTRAVFIILTFPTACAQTVPKRGVLRFFELQHRVGNIGLRHNRVTLEDAPSLPSTNPHDHTLSDT